MRSIGRFVRGFLAFAMVAGLAVGCADNNPAAISAIDGPVISQGPSKRVKTANVAVRAVRQQNVGEAGGTIPIEGGHSIYFPPGALPHVTEIYTERSEGIHIQIRFGPAGLSFPAGKKAVLTLDYSGAEDPDEETLAITYVDENGIILRVLDTQVDRVNKKMVAELDGFSRYAVAD
jgi:hypothetical protein